MGGGSGSTYGGVDGLGGNGGRGAGHSNTDWSRGTVDTSDWAPGNAGWGGGGSLARVNTEAGTPVDSTLGGPGISFVFVPTSFGCVHAGANGVECTLPSGGGSFNIAAMVDEADTVDPSITGGTQLQVYAQGGNGGIGGTVFAASTEGPDGGGITGGGVGGLAVAFTTANAITATGSSTVQYEVGANGASGAESNDTGGGAGGSSSLVWTGGPTSPDLNDAIVIGGGGGGGSYLSENDSAPGAIGGAGGKLTSSTSGTPYESIRYAAGHDGPNPFGYDAAEGGSSAGAGVGGGDSTSSTGGQDGLGGFGGGTLNFADTSWSSGTVASSQFNDAGWGGVATGENGGGGGGCGGGGSVEENNDTAGAGAGSLARDTTTGTAQLTSLSSSGIAFLFESDSYGCQTVAGVGGAVLLAPRQHLAPQPGPAGEPGQRRRLDDQR